jgi:threonine dehydrogenase-like Zn-dependent dehydrogenase
MKIAILHGPHDLRIEDRPLAAGPLAPDAIHVQTRLSAFKIGTDRGNFEGAEQVPGAPDYPRWVGDSNLGEVRAIGSAVTRVRVGQRIVTRYPHQSEYIMRQSDSLAVVPDGVADEDAVFAHLYALSSLCYRKAWFQPGERVAVVGVGLLGLGAVALGPLYGARVAAVANSPLRLEMAARMGAHTGFLSDDPDLKARLDQFTGGAGIDLVILTANPWPAYRTALEIVRPNGRVAVVSLLGRGEAPLDFNPLSMDLFYAKGISLIAVSGAAGDLFPARADTASAARFAPDQEAAFILALMADGRLKPSRLITHRFHYTQISAAYQMAAQREKSMLGVIFQWEPA